MPRLVLREDLAADRRRPIISDAAALAVAYMPDGFVVDGPLGCGLVGRAVPKFGFCCLQAATSCGSICGNGRTGQPSSAQVARALVGREQPA